MTAGDPSPRELRLPPEEMRRLGHRVIDRFEEIERTIERMEELDAG